MKNISKLLVVTAMISATSHASHRVGNGGNSIAGHFTTIASNIALVWEDICSNEDEKNADCGFIYDYKSLLNKSSSLYVTVRSQDKVYAYDQSEREAINDGVSNIIVGENKWLEMIRWATPYNRRTKLVMHEYFSILGTDGSDYYHGSNKIMSIITRKNYNIEKIAGDELLPEICSLNLTGYYDTDLTDLLKDELSKKDYKVKSRGEESRYTMEVSSECNDRIISKSCTIVAEISDNLKDSSVPPVREIVTEGGSFVRSKRLLRGLVYQLMWKIKGCKANI
jgi:hypothetical protein